MTEDKMDKGYGNINCFAKIKDRRDFIIPYTLFILFEFLIPRKKFHTYGIYNDFEDEYVKHKV